MAERAVGRTKAAVGRATGNRRMVDEGEGKNVKGHAREKSAKTAGRAQGKVEEMVGRGKQAIGSVTGNTKRRARGIKDEVKGRIRQKAND